VIDPPWPVDFVKRKCRPNQKSMPYELMSYEEILNFPIDDFSDKDSYLFLWTTQKFLPKAFQILEKWNFKYHCLLTWDKNDGMVMFGFRRQTEFILFAHRGKLSFFKKGKPIPTIFYEKLKRNSQKPDSFYRMLVRAYPEPRVDIFARRKHEGFDVWGNDRELETESLERFT